MHGQAALRCDSMAWLEDLHMGSVDGAPSFDIPGGGGPTLSLSAPLHGSRVGVGGFYDVADLAAAAGVVVGHVSSVDDTQDSIGGHGDGAGATAVAALNRADSNMSAYYRSLSVELSGPDGILLFPSLDNPAMYGARPTTAALLNALEQDVHHILAIPDFVTNVGVLGMPAFDQHHKLIGFYRDEQDSNKVSRVVFRSVPITVTATDRIEASKLLAHALAEQIAHGSFGGSGSGGSGSSIIDHMECRNGPVFTITDWQEELEQMKEDAMIFYVKAVHENEMAELIRQEFADGE